MKNTICLCWYCIQAIKSRGEHVSIIDSIVYSETFDSEITTECEWCKEECNEEDLYECSF